MASWRAYILLVAAASAHEECARLHIADQECGSQGDSLGTSFATVDECGEAAASDGCAYIMWSPYSYSWGCRCCTGGGEDGGDANANWAVYEVVCEADPAPTGPTAAPAPAPTLDACFDTTRGGCWDRGFVDNLGAATYCQLACQLEPGCEYFSYHPDRADKRCHLCSFDADWSSGGCADESRCVFGPATCDGADAETPGTLLAAAVAVAAALCAAPDDADAASNLERTLELNAVLSNYAQGLYDGDDAFEAALDDAAVSAAGTLADPDCRDLPTACNFGAGLFTNLRALLLLYDGDATRALAGDPKRAALFDAHRVFVADALYLDDASLDAFLAYYDDVPDHLMADGVLFDAPFATLTVKDAYECDGDSSAAVSNRV